MKIHKLNPKDSNYLTISPVESALYVLDFVKRKPVFSDLKLEIILEKQDLNCKIVCLCLLEEGEKFSFDISVSHLALGTKSKTIFKSALKNKARLDFKGLVYISPKAFGSKTSLEDRALIIGEGVYNRAQPMMKIENNDVEASHASATGRLDENQIFYLCSRGLSRKESEDLLIGSFLSINNHDI